ncbi:MAG: dephospho-CoA kinase [Gemmatimonadetes bacterium]|nr:dephospho-CoA kinase [Gemmatimonadota bacterium]
MLSVALTGGLGSGKSEVLRIWARSGVPVVSADELSRRAVEPGTPGLAEVRRAFGDGVIGPDGGLDRARMRERVFVDEAARRKLEGILHPRIAALREDWIAARHREGHALVVAEIPLLFETGSDTQFDVTVAVDAPEVARLARLASARGLAETDARRIMVAQMDPAEKRRRAHHVLENAGSLAQLETHALDLLDRLRREADALGGPQAGSGFLRIDFHMHSWGSHDCLAQPEGVLEAAQSRGVGRIALTDHDRLDVSLRMAERYPDAIIPAEEVRTAEGIDVIGLYLHTEIPKRTPAREVCERVHEQGGLVYLPHPYAKGKGGGGRLAEELAPLVDVIEVFNGRLHDPRQNERAADLAERHGRLRGAGSDAHTLGEVARSWVELPLHPNEPAALLRALPRGRVHGTTAGRWVHLASSWAKVRHRLPGAPRTS